MSKAILTFGEIEIEKQTLDRYKNFTFKKDTDINNISLSSKITNTLLVTWMMFRK